MDAVGRAQKYSEPAVRRGDTLDLEELELAAVHAHVSWSTAIYLVHNYRNLPV